MPIPDEAREALTKAFEFERQIDTIEARPGYYVNRVETVLAAAGYTVVKVTDLHQQAAATPDDMDVVARRLGYVPVPDERALERTIHNSICPCDAYVNPMAPDSCAGERTMAMATARRAVLALLRGEGQTDG